MAAAASHTAEVRRVDTSLESHSTEIEASRIDSETRQGPDATSQPQRLSRTRIRRVWSGAARAPEGPWSLPGAR